MKKLATNTMLIIVLTILSAVIYLLQIVCFHDEKTTLFYFFQDLAFIPIQVLIVTLLINKLVTSIGNHQNRKRINVIISVFFSELGSDILLELSRFCHNTGDLCKEVDFKGFQGNLVDAKKKIRTFDFQITATDHHLNNLASILIEKKSYMIDMLESSSLMEHDSFTDMLWSVFHIADELQYRKQTPQSAPDDIAHLSNDILRAYRLILIEWTSYMKYLCKEYPYLYSMALRKNPFHQQSLYAQSIDFLPSNHITETAYDIAE